MTAIQLRNLLDVLSSFLLYGGVFLGGSIILIGSSMGLSSGDAFEWQDIGRPVVAGLVLLVQGLIFGGGLKLLLSIDERLERLEKRS